MYSKKLWPNDVEKSFAQNTNFSYPKLTSGYTLAHKRAKNKLLAKVTHIDMAAYSHTYILFPLLLNKNIWFELTQ
jgi:hypothetical protein